MHVYQSFRSFLFAFFFHLFLSSLIPAPPRPAPPRTRPQSRETNILLADVIKHVKKDNAYKALQPQLQLVISKILQYRTNFEQLLAMEHFMPVLDLLEKDFKFAICKALLESFAKCAAPK